MADHPPSKAQRTRRHIIEKAAPVFNKRGYAGTSLADLTRATGLTKGAIYGNFANKDELALVCFRYNLDRIREYVIAELERRRGSLNKLLAYPHAFRQAYAEVAHMGGCPIANTAVDSDDTHRELHGLVLEAIEVWRASLVHLVERGLARGEIRPEADPQRVAETLIALVEGGSTMAKTTGRESFMLNALDQAEKLIESLRA